MELYVFRALWGMTGPLTEQIERIAAAGYDGVEAWIEQGSPAPSVLLPLLERSHLKLIVATRVLSRDKIGPTLTHLAEYRPLKINLHSGQDSMSREDGSAFFEEALHVEGRIRVPVCHETHRGRLFYTPWDTAFYLSQFDALKINADYSHWVNVCERLPDDQAEALDLANRRAVHIHGRVGYEQGPQVPDPAAPEYAPHLAWHEAQWRQIGQHQRQAGAPHLTFTPEYGPPTYLHTLPYTNVPVADLWEVCLWAAKRARQQLSQSAS